MKNIFLDTNVIIDFLTDRKPFSDDAAILFQFAKEKKIRIFISAISFNNAYYILRKFSNHKIALSLISELDEWVEVQETNKKIIRKAIKSSFNDFDDAIQYYSALEIGNINLITTRDLKDFKKSEIPVFSPETTVKLLLEE